MFVLTLRKVAFEYFAII